MNSASLVVQMVKKLPAMQETPVGKFSWTREWLPTPIFLPREFHGQRSLAGYSPWDCKESDMTGWLTLFTCTVWAYEHWSRTLPESQSPSTVACMLSVLKSHVMFLSTFLFHPLFFPLDARLSLVRSVSFPFICDSGHRWPHQFLISLWFLDLCYLSVFLTY